MLNINYVFFSPSKSKSLKGNHAKNDVFKNCFHTNKLSNPYFRIMGKAIKSPITIFLSLDPITWKVGRANKKVVVLCIKHPNQIFNICSNIKFDKYDETLLRVAQKTWIKKYLRNFYVSQMSWAEQIEHLQLSEVGKWSNIRGAISEILLNIYLCLHFTKG